MFHLHFTITCMASKSFNHGIYADLIKQYIDYKRSLGFKMEDTDERLRRFDTLTIEHEETKTGISKELFDQWSKPFPEESECNRYIRISILRQFSAYLQLIGYDSYIPKLPKYSSTFTPHIYTKKEISSIFEACDKLFVKRRYMYSQICVMPTLVRLLYGTGLRVGEALKLKHKDVNLEQGFIILHECKNGCDRAVPLSNSLVEVFKDYLMYKQNQSVNIDSESVFFTAPDGSSCKVCTVYEIFRTILFKAGISYQGRGIGPRLHDLRHTFCVNTLVRMSEAGLDLYYSMPILMTFIGHQSVEATNKYVRLTSEMYPNLLMKVDEAYKYIFPDIDIDINNVEPENDDEP